MRGAPVIGRRALLRGGAGAALAGLLAGCTRAPEPGAVTVAGGEPGGFYLEFASLLAEALTRHGVAQTAGALETGGSLDNMDRLAAGEATLAITLADAAAERLAGPAPSSAPGRLVALGKVYENYVHCIVRRNAGISTLADLAGRSAAVGDPRAGTSLTARRLIEASGIPEGSLREEPLGLNQGLAALRDGAVEALFWSGGVPTAAIASASRELSLALLDLSPLIAPTRARHGAFYDRVLIPDGTYAGIPATWTVGVANLLLCREDLDAEVARRTVELLLTRAAELVPRSSLGVQFLSPDTLINTAGIPLHPGAEAAYRAFHG
ncbi:TAXI family TRAP transporter solute-binding subunit [Sinomonas mesophila]|uniref:TAXI family TRAP transporter solute-binding subunit n=1 Tax=Sinomonas mesophila TaxID=1531955 RepID=UPI000984B0DC|nr:TAXI family TRAP transporter solute-binding subunit [Sinomonas mesophila]